MEKTLCQDKIWLFEKAPVGKAVAALAIPAAISQMIMMIYNLADSFFVGQLDDPDQMAALALALPVQLLMTALSNLFGVGGGVVISRALGRRDETAVKQASAFTVYGTALTTALCAITATVFRRPFLTLLGATPAIWEYTNNYVVWIMVIGGIPSTFNMAVSALIRAEGSSQEASFGLSMGAVINIILDPIFIFPFGLGMEVKGAAVATCLSNCATSLYFLHYLHRNRRKTVLALHPSYFMKSRPVVKSILLGGLPAALQVLFAAISNLMVNKIIVGFGEEAMAGVGICKKVDSVPAYMILGITQGIVPLVAYNYGAGNYKRMQESIRFTLTTTLSLSFGFVAVMQIFPHTISSLFIDVPTTIVYAEHFIRIHCLALPFSVFSYLLVGVFQAIKKNRQATVLSLLRKGIFDVPIMFLLNSFFPLYGPIMCQPLMDAVAAGCAIVMYRRIRKEIAITDCCISSL